MYKNIQRLLVTLAALTLVGVIAACSPSENKTSMSGSADDATVNSDNKMGASQAASNAQVNITNPMPHDMTVSADWGQGEKELGTVKPNETKTFDIAAAEGTTVNLTATDAARSHNPKGAITLSANTPAAWTIQ